MLTVLNTLCSDAILLVLVGLCVYEQTIATNLLVFMNQSVVVLEPPLLSVYITMLLSDP